MLTPGPYVLKCPRESAVRVAGFTAQAGRIVTAERLGFHEAPLSVGVLKGGPAELRDDDSRRGFRALRAGDTETALAAFDVALTKDPRSQEAFRGKAQVLLAKAARADAQGDGAGARRLRAAAVRADPRLSEDPQLAQLLPGLPAAPAAPPPPPGLTTANLEGAYPRRSQRLGVGLSPASPHGIFVVSVDWVVREWLQLGAHLSPLFLGVGISARGLSRSGTWSPYVGLGLNATLAGLGAIEAHDAHVAAGDVVLARREIFDRVGYVELGLQACGRHWQAEAGVAVGVAAPRGQSIALAVYPALTLRYFP